MLPPRCEKSDGTMCIPVDRSSIGLHITVPFMSMLLDHKVTPRQLLSILPNLYNDLLNYQDTMCQIQSCGIQSLSSYFLNPKKKESSPCGVEVSKSLEEYLQSTDPEIMNLYLKKMSLVIAEILKRRRVNQYGFGDVNSDDFIMNNMDDTMLDDADATHTKPVENFFGIMDREIKKAGPQGFATVSDDLIIKYARDLVVGDYQWWSKTNRKKGKELKEKEAEFSALQQELIKSDVDEQDSVKLTESNQMLKCIASYKKSHNGPVTTVDELKLLVATWDSTEKALHSQCTQLRNSPSEVDIH